MNTAGHALVLAVAALLAAGGGPPAIADAELTLEDGQSLRGLSVERKDGLFLLELDSGSVLPIPEELVVELRLTGRGERAGVADEDDAAGEPAEPVPADGRTAEGLHVGEPETLAGPPAGPELPERHEQLAAFGPPARVARAVIDPYWRPHSDWGGHETDVTQFNPADWYRSPIDSEWRPTSAYGWDTDVTEFNPADWYRPAVPFRWRPTDGFSRPD